jgi:hypothetical protein
MLVRAAIELHTAQPACPVAAMACASATAASGDVTPVRWAARIDVDEHASVRRIARIRQRPYALSGWSATTDSAMRALSAPAGRSPPDVTTGEVRWIFPTPSAASASASPNLAQHIPTAPAAICRRAISPLLWVLACGLQRDAAFGGEGGHRWRCCAPARRGRSSMRVSADSPRGKGVDHGLRIALSPIADSIGQIVGNLAG